MNVYIVGRGAVGSFLGDRLSSVGVNVAYAPRALEDVTRVEADVAIVAVKSYDTPAAIESLKRAIAAPGNCVFVSPQNGLGNEDLLAEAFGERNVVAAALTVPVDRDRDGRVAAAKEGGLALAPLGGAAYNWLSATFQSAGIAVKVCEDWRALKWSKLALNIVANASCAILNVLPNRLVQFEKIFTLEIRAIREVRDVMKSLGLAPVDLPRYPVRALFAIASLPSPIARRVLAGRVASARGTKPPSLLLDLRSGRERTEVESLCGAVAMAGRTQGIPTPVNAVYARVLADIAQMPQLWAKYRERPEALLDEVYAEMKRAKARERGKHA